jgi:STE24 endopeptidase
MFHPVLLLFGIIILAKWATEFALNILNRRHIDQCRGGIPEAFKEVMTQESYDKSISYSFDKSRFAEIEGIVDTILVGVFLFLGVLPWCYDIFTSWLGEGIWSQSLILLLVSVFLSLFSLPLEWWEQFKIESKYGFNTSSAKLWISDKLKGLALTFIIGYPMIVMLLGFFHLFERTWWIWGFLAFFIFQLLMVILYPMIIMPLFNKLEPLGEGSLKDRLMKLSKKTGFLAKTIQVIDGSKRSTHSNAFFTGFGRFRRIVLFDTLIEQLQDEELEGVLAHEIGHYKKGHVPKMLIISALTGLGAFAALGWLAGSAWFIESFGFTVPNPETGEGTIYTQLVPAILLFTILSSYVTFWFAPFSNSMSRRHEYEADAFASVMIRSPQPLILALRKLHEKNLSNLTPHPFYSRFYYSHPTLLEREDALNSRMMEESVTP